MRPLQNAPFCPISALGSNFNPHNTQCIPVVKIYACLELESRYSGKHFSKSHYLILIIEAMASEEHRAIGSSG